MAFLFFKHKKTVFSPIFISNILSQVYKEVYAFEIINYREEITLLSQKIYQSFIELNGEGEIEFFIDDVFNFIYLHLPQHYLKEKFKELFLTNEELKDIYWNIRINQNDVIEIKQKHWIDLFEKLSLDFISKTQYFFLFSILKETLLAHKRNYNKSEKEWFLFFQELILNSLHKEPRLIYFLQALKNKYNFSLIFQESWLTGSGFNEKKEKQDKKNHYSHNIGKPLLENKVKDHYFRLLWKNYFREQQSYHFKIKESDYEIVLDELSSLLSIDNENKVSWYGYHAFERKECLSYLNVNNIYKHLDSIFQPNIETQLGKDKDFLLNDKNLNLSNSNFNIANNNHNGNGHYGWNNHWGKTNNRNSKDDNGFVNLDNIIFVDDLSSIDTFIQQRQKDLINHRNDKVYHYKAQNLIKQETDGNKDSNNKLLQPIQFMFLNVALNLVYLFKKKFFTSITSLTNGNVNNLSKFNDNDNSISIGSYGIGENQSLAQSLFLISKEDLPIIKNLFNQFLQQQLCLDDFVYRELNKDTFNFDLTQCFSLEVNDDYNSIQTAITESILKTKWFGNVVLDFKNIRKKGNLIQQGKRISNGIQPYVNMLDSLILSQGRESNDLPITLSLPIYHYEVLSLFNHRSNKSKKKDFDNLDIRNFNYDNELAFNKRNNNNSVNANNSNSNGVSTITNKNNQNNFGRLNNPASKLQNVFQKEENLALKQQQDVINQQTKEFLSNKTEDCLNRKIVISSLFMKRVLDNGEWFLLDPYYFKDYDLEKDYLIVEELVKSDSKISKNAFFRYKNANSLLNKIIQLAKLNRLIIEFSNDLNLSCLANKNNLFDKPNIDINFVNFTKNITNNIADNIITKNKTEDNFVKNSFSINSQNKEKAKNQNYHLTYSSSINLFSFIDKKAKSLKKDNLNDLLVCLFMLNYLFDDLSINVFNIKDNVHAFYFFKFIEEFIQDKYNALRKLGNIDLNSSSSLNININLNTNAKLNIESFNHFKDFNDILNFIFTQELIINKGKDKGKDRDNNHKDLNQLANKGDDNANNINSYSLNHFVEAFNNIRERGILNPFKSENEKFFRFSNSLNFNFNIKPNEFSSFLLNVKDNGFGVKNNLLQIFINNKKYIVHSPSFIQVFNENQHDYEIFEKVFLKISPYFYKKYNHLFKDFDLTQENVLNQSKEIHVLLPFFYQGISINLPKNLDNINLAIINAWLNGFRFIYFN